MSKLSAFQAKMAAKLEGGQFRFINERLYTQPSKDSLDMMRKDPSLFTAYHNGYRSQVEGWPINPLDVMINEIKKTPTAVVGDFGCGEARLSASVSNKVHSFDLVAVNDKVVACDIANVPLGADSLDIAVYCLSLMGTNFMQFIKEAHRVLKSNGRLLIAEVKSRFETAGEEDSHVKASGSKRSREGLPTTSGLHKFISAIKGLGFQLEHMDERNKMFVVLFFRKTGGEPSSRGAGAGKATSEKPKSKGSKSSEKRETTPPSSDGLMKACIYKRR